MQRIDTVIDTLAVDGWAVTFGTARRGLGGLRAQSRPLITVSNVTAEPTHQRPVYQLHIIRCVNGESQNLTPATPKPR